MSSNVKSAVTTSNDNDVVIRASNLSKIYQIYNQPQDRLKQSLLPRLQKMMGRQPRQYYREFWALKDVSFEVRKGETVGIIGRNGAGKSTLLQIICGTLSPSLGEVEVHGRVAALLELGSGFNPEFTGRENVYMNASILGLTREETDKQFDQICAFADIGDFINQPVKSYSSGMMVRLAFAVIAHVNADILVVDEALAVGDAIFTQKCMRFIRKFQKTGTLIFVSHDTASVQNLCQRAVWLANGSVEASGTSKTVVEEYLRYTLQATYGDDFLLEDIKKKEEKLVVQSDEVSAMEEAAVIDYAVEVSLRNQLDTAGGWQTGDVEIVGVSLEKSDADVHNTNIFKGGDQVRLSVEAIVHKPISQPIMGFLCRDKLGQDLFGENTLSVTSIEQLNLSAGESLKAQFEFRLPMLPNGDYSINIAFAEGDALDYVQHNWLYDAVIMTVSSSKVRWGLVGVSFDFVGLVKGN